jgi:hypothetical protein
MPMMDVRVVRMLVRERLVPMNVGVRLLPRFAGSMGMLVVLIVPMGVTVNHGLVRVHMLVPSSRIHPIQALNVPVGGTYPSFRGRGG